MESEENFKKKIEGIDLSISILEYEKRIITQIYQNSFYFYSEFCSFWKVFKDTNNCIYVAFLSFQKGTVQLMIERVKKDKKENLEYRVNSAMAITINSEEMEHYLEMVLEYMPVIASVMKNDTTYLASFRKNGLLTEFFSKTTFNNIFFSLSDKKDYS